MSHCQDMCDITEPLGLAYHAVFFDVVVVMVVVHRHLSWIGLLVTSPL